jgi:hypothetical protein
METTRVIEGDLFDQSGVIVIPTNLIGIHGAGVAKTAFELGLVEQEKGKLSFDGKIVTIPTKYHWRDRSSNKLLREGIDFLIMVANNNKDKKFYVPLLGIGHGGLDPEYVARKYYIPLLEETENVYIVMPTKKVFDMSPKARTRKDNSYWKIDIVKSILNGISNGKNKRNQGNLQPNNQ